MVPSLFDGPESEDGAVRTPPLPDEYDPFADGRDWKPGDRPLDASPGFQSVGAQRTGPSLSENPELSREAAEQARAKARAKPVDHQGRTRAYFEKRGYVYAKTEWMVTTYSGMTYKKDLLHIFDGIALGVGDIVGIQIGANVTAKVRDLCSGDPVKSDSKATKRGNLQAWLRAGGTALVIAWVKEGAHYKPYLRHVTQGDIDTVASGGRLKAEAA